MTYTLTAEQMQQVREKVSAAQTTAFERWGGSSGELPPDPRNMNDRDANDFCIRNGADGFDAAVIYWHTAAALALLDAAMQAPEATAGGDVREAVECGICGRPESYGDHDASQLPATLAHPFVPKPMLEAYRMGFITGQRRTGAYETAAVADYRNTIETWTVKLARDLAALAAAPKPCEHGCQLGDGAIARLVTTGEPCPIHGTKPEAPTELCKVCGECISPREMMCMDCGASLHDACVRAHDRDCPGPAHPFTPTDATPKDEEPGR